jgi:probable HAF family extracellular repeat protein
MSEWRMPQNLMSIVHAHQTGVKRLCHPVVGELDLTFELVTFAVDELPTETRQTLTARIVGSATLPIVVPAATTDRLGGSRKSSGRLPDLHLRRAVVVVGGVNISMSPTKLAAAAGTLAVGATLALAGSAHAAVEYSLTLTNPPDAGDNSPFQQAPLLAINNLGVPVGVQSFPDVDQFLGTRGTDLQRLTVPGDAKGRNHSSQAVDINDGGAAVGEAQKTNAAGPISMLGPERPFIWDAGSDVGRELSIFPGQSVVPKSITNAGDVAGFTFPGNGEDTGNPNRTTAFVMSHDGTVTTLPPIPGGTAAKAAAVNASGLVVGQSQTTTSISVQHAAEWRDGVVRDLGVLPGGHFSAAVKVNAGGTAVGFSDNGHADQATAWIDGAITNLNFPGSSTQAEGIDDAGTIVGLSGTTTDNERAIRYQNGTSVDLNTLVAPGSGYTLAIANDVNENGQIAGLARQDAHPSHLVGFVLTPTR